jgi:hypothetical protein
MRAQSRVRLVNTVLKFQRPLPAPASFWLCDNCHEHGPAGIEPNDSIRIAIDRIAAAHFERSPSCQANGTTQYLRIVDSAEIARRTTRQ